jgi:hypothetical protein
VHPPQTSALAQRGGSDLAIEHVGHLAILFHPDAVREIVSFLAAPDVTADPPAAGSPSAMPLEPPRELAGA